ncbi:uncharacterized protein LOC135172586 [Diachasmimorpha longicaudata]|uniref:uncharacterized protein LOC135172586 n=1 Tax=Diachasmimorpha longicaudata TaxID=58733 RepID=UPI0030B8FE63
MMLIEILAQECGALYRWKGTGGSQVTVRKSATSREDTLDAEDVSRRGMEECQRKWNTPTKQRWTYRLIPEMSAWVHRQHGEVNYYLTQLLSGDGCFRESLHRFDYEDSPDCPACPGAVQDAEHIFFVCPRFVTNLPMAAWEAASNFAAEVMTDLRREERLWREFTYQEEEEEQDPLERR